MGTVMEGRMPVLESSCEGIGRERTAGRTRRTAGEKLHGGRWFWGEEFAVGPHAASPIPSEYGACNLRIA
jgi:hypothetical protein